MKRIAEYLDYPSWYYLQSLDSVWKTFVPLSFPMVDSPNSEEFWKSPEVNRRSRLSSLFCDSFSGGVCTFEGNYGVILRMLRSYRGCFSALVLIDLTGQWMFAMQIKHIFASKGASDFPSLKSASFLIISDRSGNRRNPSGDLFVPPRLECLSLSLENWTLGSEQLELIRPLVHKAKHLKLFMESFDMTLMLFHEKNIVTEVLETSIDCIRLLFSFQNMTLKSVFPKIRRIIIHTVDGVLITDKVDKESLLHGPYLQTETLSWRSDRNPVSIDSRLARTVESISYKSGNLVIAPDHFCQLQKLVRVSKLSLLCSWWEGESGSFVQALSLLRSYPRLESLTLPREFLMAWCADAQFRQEFDCFAACVELPRLRWLHFACNEPISNLNLVTARGILNGEYCDSILPLLARMFPNLETLIIDPVPLLRCGPHFALLKVRKLFLVHSRRLQYDHSTRRLAFWTWLPNSNSLEVLILYTQQLNWLDERGRHGLIECLAKSPSLRFALVVTYSYLDQGNSGVTMRDMSTIVEAWCKRRVRQGRYVIFVCHTSSTLRCLVARPKARKDRCPFKIAYVEFSRWDDLMASYPELYSVFWKDFTSVIKL